MDELGEEELRGQRAAAGRAARAYLIWSWLGVAPPRRSTLTTLARWYLLGVPATVVTVGLYLFLGVGIDAHWHFSAQTAVAVVGTAVVTLVNVGKLGAGFGMLRQRARAGGWYLCLLVVQLLVVSGCTLVLRYVGQHHRIVSDDGMATCIIGADIVVDGIAGVLLYLSGRQARGETM
jgi:hypothetical protein